MSIYRLSRGIDIQTQSIVVSNTPSIVCGTPSYMDPELKLNKITVANQEDLKCADMWSIGMIMHVMMNPELGCPIALKQSSWVFPIVKQS